VIRGVSVFIATSYVVAGCAERAPSVNDGTYYGYEPRISLSPDQPEAVWFNSHVLTVRGASVELRKSAGYVLGEEVFSSASDGGFRTFDGTLKALGGRTLVGLRQLTCDYCEPPAEDAPLPSKRVREYVLIPFEDGSFEVDHVRFYADENQRSYWMPRAQ
jgi:hypothetical protein